jgi:DNA mismatch repair ATPase MutS
MKGDQPHAGFPEKNYEAHGERLARAGHRVCVIEQTETPDALEARKKATGVKDKVVRREMVALLTRGKTCAAVGSKMRSVRAPNPMVWLPSTMVKLRSTEVARS